MRKLESVLTEAEIVGIYRGGLSQLFDKRSFLSLADRHINLIYNLGLLLLLWGWGGSTCWRSSCCDWGVLIVLLVVVSEFIPHLLSILGGWTSWDGWWSVISPVGLVWGCCCTEQQELWYCVKQVCIRGNGCCCDIVVLDQRPIDSLGGLWTLWQLFSVPNSIIAAILVHYIGFVYMKVIQSIPLWFSMWFHLNW